MKAMMKETLFFLFDGKERAQEEALLEEMLYFAKNNHVLCPG